MISVLCVDDEPALLDVTKRYLEQNGSYLVDTCTSVAEAIEKMRISEYDAVVSDYQLPGINGIEFLKKLRNSGNSIPFIIYTGRGSEEVVISACNAGVDAYIRKEGEPRAIFINLMHAIEQTVKRKKIENELKFDNALLEAQQEVSPDGILVIGKSGKILSRNKRFTTMWEIPEIVQEMDSSKEITRNIKKFLINPSGLLPQLECPEIQGRETSREEILLNDNRTFDCRSAPLFGPDSEFYGRVWYFRDISERKNAETALNESVEKYRVLIESAKEAIFIIQDGFIVYTNPKGLEMIDVPQDQIASRNFLEYVYPEDRKEAQDRHTKRLNGEPLDSLAQMRIVDKSGEIHWIEIDAVIVPWNGKPATLNFATDITKRKLAEQALRENEAKFHEIFDNVNDGIELHELQESGLPGRYLEINDVTCRMLQYTYDELLQKNPLDIATPEHSIPLSEIARMFKTAGHVIFETGHRRKDGTIIPVEINGHTVTISGKKAVLAVIRDITERRKQEQAIRDSEQRLKQITENAEAWIWETDADGKYTYSNPVVEKILGYSSEDLVGKLYFYDFYEPEDRDKWKSLGLAVYRDHGSFHRFVSTNVNKDGSEIFIESTGTPIVDHNGNLLGYRGASLDVTDRKRAEEAVKQSLREKELLLKEIHHRVKNNLQTISSILYLQSLSVKDEDQLTVLQDVRSRVTSMGLIHQKLYQSSNIATIPFTDYIYDLIEFLSDSFNVDRERIRIVIDILPSDLSLDIDTGIPCGLIINELVTNALKYAFKGRDKGIIRIFLSRDNNQRFTLTVSDDGVGFPEGFERNSQSSLGMTLVSGLVDQLGGSLEFVIGKGATVNIRFSQNSQLGGLKPEKPENGEKTDIPHEPMENQGQITVDP